MSNMFAQVVLLSWIPIVLILFSMLRPREAVISAFVIATLFLPNISFALSGLPDFGKTSATVYAVVLCIVLFDVQKALSIKLYWYDISILMYCVGCPLISGSLNNSGSYEAISAVLDQMFYWGLPYFIGRIYLSDLEGMKRFCLGLAIGGIIYAPFCLIEIRMSPQFANWFYGFDRAGELRFGGYRPKVFFSQGLELGIWMTSSTMMAWNLWNSGAVKRLWGYSFKYLTIFLTVVTILCKATGALGLLAFGMAILWIVRRTGKFWPIWLMLAISPVYAVSRTTGIWSGADFVEIIKATVGEDRAQSVEYRFICEDILFDFVWKKPIFGFGRMGGFNKNEDNETQKSIIDGYWIIVLGTNGFLGLTMFMLIHLTPLVLVARRFPAKTWNQPDVAPAVALTLMLSLFMIEDLSNAMPNQIYALVMGGGVGLGMIKRAEKNRSAGTKLARAMGLAREGNEWEAEAEFRQVISQSSGRNTSHEVTTIRATAFEGLGQLLRKSGRAAEAEAAFREGLFDRLGLTFGSTDPNRSRDLALAHEALARALADLGQVDQAIKERQRAMTIWDDLTSSRHTDPAHTVLRADALNDLAWLLTAGSDPSHLDPARAADLAAEAVRLAPDRLAFWNTLGVARYRAGDWAGAAEALEHSVEIGPPGGTAFDLFFLAMAYFQLDQIDRAKECRDRATKWADRHRPDHHGLASFRSEVAAMFEADV